MSVAMLSFLIVSMTIESCNGVSCGSGEPGRQAVKDITAAIIISAFIVLV